MTLVSKNLADTRLGQGGAAIYSFMPGLALAIVLSVSAYVVAGFAGLPSILLALLFGLAAQPLVSGQAVRPGLNLAAKKMLRVGVGCLGAGVIASDIAALGWPVLVLCMVCVAFTIAVGCATARVLRSDTASGLLFGGAVAICGASAALAISAALPQTEENNSKTLVAVIGVTALSTIAMVLYPLITAYFGMSDKAAGIFFGAAIHDVAQVVGAGYMVSDAAGETATMVKLVRVSCLLPVVAIIAYSMSKTSAGKAAGMTGGRAQLFPVFLLGFVFLSIIASSGLIAPIVLDGIVDAGKALLLMAIAALGCLTSVQALCKIGWAPVTMLVIPTISLAVFALLVLASFPTFF